MKVDLKNLPTSPQELKNILLHLHQSLHQTQSEFSAYKEKYAHLLEEIRMAKQQRFSPSSEKNILQPDLFDEAGVELPEEVKDQLADEAEVKSTIRKKHPMRRPLPSYLPRERVVLAAFKKWLDHHLLKTSEQGAIGKAIRYCLAHWIELNNYLKDGRVEIDNNLIENAIRPFALGRKNWMFNGSPAGAKAGATFFSLIETRKANNIEPYQYLCAMFNRIRQCVTTDDYRGLLPQFIQF